MAQKLYYDDIKIGDTFTGATVTVDHDKMLEFAVEFDDQPMHLDASAARAMGLKDIVANGAYTFALNSKSVTKIWQQWHFLPSGLGIEVSFTRPIYAGDVLTGEMEVLSVRPSSNPGRGWLETIFRASNQDGEVAFTTKANFLLLCRPD
ncbi:MAG: hypothetical protein COB93_04205 [Sneathiella sp.]|nr:MAG: hypothetical protein COB93_04205 [Sneathiella sp.]